MNSHMQSYIIIHITQIRINVCTSAHTHTRACIHAFTHIRAHTRTHPRALTQTYARARVRKYLCALAHIAANTHAHTHTHSYTRLYIYTNTHTHAPYMHIPHLLTHTHTHILTHTLTHACAHIMGTHAYVFQFTKITQSHTLRHLHSHPTVT